MYTATVEEVQAQLPEMLDRVQAGEELVITRGGRSVARLTAEVSSTPPVLGTGTGTVLYMSPDFDAPLSEFKDYTP